MLFNVVQNAVKYNLTDGKIVIILRLKQSNFGTEDKAELEIEVIDTGIGIEKNRQNLLFQPFKELSQKQNLKLVKDNSIGMGLAFTNELINKLGGQIRLQES